MPSNLVIELRIEAKMADCVYILPRDRDAYSTIRGFVYQVDLTIRRWMDLGSDQHLELEYGEDIDLVKRAVTADTAEESQRLLEQIKHREQNLTLRNPAALEALANAVEHLATNTGLDLRFCFTTNAGVGTERPCLFPNGTAGISLWEQVRQGQLTGSVLADATKALAQFLSQASCPDGLDANVWIRFQQVVNAADLSDFSALIARFEWSTSATGAAAITPEIIGLLTHRSLAADAAEADQLYQRLFLFVFKRLCQPGIKRLTRAELQQQLSTATLSATDHATLARLTHCFAIVRSKVDELETALASVSDGVRQLARTQGIHATLLRGTLSIDLAPPPLLARHSPRAEVVGRLAEQLERSVWTALTGASDSGKSQLAVLLIARVGNLAGWLRFGHEMQPAEACATLDSAIASMCGQGRPEAESGWYLRACQRIGPGKLIILDDLPRMNGTDPLTQRLVLLASACKHAGVRLFSTSHHQPVTRFVSGLGEAEFAVVPVPMLTEAEVRETLAAYEAPETVLARGPARLIHISTGGHPLLVSLAADYLRGREWRFSDEEIEGLLRGEHAESITDEVLNRIMSSLADQQRELLYRLTLPLGAFQFEVVGALAQVTPVVVRPREQLNKLLGAWVQRDAERRFIVSPLVRCVGSENLTGATKIGCHLSLAELIVREPMSIYQAQQAIMHFCHARAFDRAGSLFLFLLDQARTLVAGKDIGLLDAMWADSPLPDGMDLNIRLLARGLQLAVLPKYNRPIDYILDDLDRLMAAATEAHRHAITRVAVLAAVYLAERDPDRTLEYIGRALSPSTAQQAGDEDMFDGKGQRLDDVLWFLVPQLVTVPRLNAWLSILEQLPAERRQRLLTGEDALLGCIVVADRLRLAEAVKPEVQRQWESVVAAVDELRIRARAMGSGVLEAAAIRTLLAVHGEHLRQLDNAVSTATEAITRLKGDPFAIFMIAGMLGRQYALMSRYDEARPMLEAALVQPASIATHERMLTLLAANESFGAVDPNQSIRYAQEAVEIARADERMPVIEATRAGAELATSIFLASPNREGAIAVFATWSEAAERLFEGCDDSDEFKDLFVIFAHHTSFLTHFVLHGQPPSHIASGAEFAPPIRGVFIRTHPERAAYYRPSHPQSVMWMLSQYASASGNDQAARRWLGRASSKVDITRLSRVEAAIAHDMIPDLVSAGEYAEAIDAALRYCHAQHILPPTEDQDQFESSVDATTSWGDLEAIDREAIERFAAHLAVLPAVCRVGSLFLADNEHGIAESKLLASACRQVSIMAADSDLWTAIAQTLEQVFRDRASVKELMALRAANADNSRRVVAIIAYLGASLHGTPDVAFDLQMAVMEILFGWFPPTSTIHHRLLLPFIEHFWVTRFAQRRFSFRNLSMVEEELNQARHSSPQHRLKAILRAIRSGVVSQSDSSAMSWLNADL